MTSNSRADDEDPEDLPRVPAGVIDGIADVVAGRTANGDDLDQALAE